MKELANEFWGQFECLGEKTKKYKTFWVINIDNNGNESVVTTSHQIKLIDSASFMTNLLSNLVDNLTEGIHKIECKDCDCFLEYENVKNNLIKYKFYLVIKIIQIKLMKN